MRIYVDNYTRGVSISRGCEVEPTHVLPIEAIMTDEPDTSESGDRNGLRVKGTALAIQLMPAFQLMLVALAANATVGEVLSLKDIPTITDADLEKFLKD
jgi:hypothetical protein